MIVAAFQPYLLPYIGYFRLIQNADIFVILDNVSYRKKSYINRNLIRLNDQPHRFTVPVKKVSQNRMINEHEYMDDGGVVDLFLRAYPDAAKFSNVLRPLTQLKKHGESKIAFNQQRNVAHVNTECISAICTVLGISTTIINASELPNIDETGTHRIIKICQLLNASEYLNPIGGADLYDDQVFENAGIKLTLKDFRAEVDETMPLSIVDSLFTLGEEATIERLGGFDD